MKLSDLKPDEKIPVDQNFLRLYGEVLQGTCPYYFAIIKCEGIKPFSSYKPEANSALRHSFLKDITNKKPPLIHVYPKDGVFIMSDDYHTYYSYIEYGADVIPCIVMGDPTGDYVIDKKKLDIPKTPAVRVVEEPTKN